MSAVTSVTSSSHPAPTLKKEPLNGNHISDAELRNALIRFDILIRVATQYFSMRFANQICSDRDNFLHNVREKAIAQKNWSREVFVNKIFLDITTNHFKDFFRSTRIPELLLMIRSDAVCISQEVLDAAQKSATLKKLIIGSLKYSTHLTRAAESGLIECVKLSLQQGADPNLQDIFGKTGLHYAAIKGWIDIMKVLLESKANPNIRDKNGKTPLEYAIESGCIEAQNLLRLRKG